MSTAKAWRTLTEITCDACGRPITQDGCTFIDAPTLAHKLIHVFDPVAQHESARKHVAEAVEQYAKTWEPA